MELHKAIHSILYLKGKKFITNPIIINVLEDHKVFDSNYPLKFILETIIKKGYAERMLSIGSWNNEVEKLCELFIKQTACQREYVIYVFKCIAYGLEFINNVNVEDINIKQNNVQREYVEQHNISATNQQQQMLTNNYQQVNKNQATIVKSERNFSGCFSKYLLLGGIISLGFTILAICWPEGFHKDKNNEIPKEFGVFIFLTIVSFILAYYSRGFYKKCPNCGKKHAMKEIKREPFNNPIQRNKVKRVTENGRERKIPYTEEIQKIHIIRKCKYCGCRDYIEKEEKTEYETT